METFNSSRAETAVVQSTTLGVCLGAGIFNGAFVHRFGPVKANFVGTSLVSIGLMVSVFATSVTYMVFSLGACMGLGITMMTISSNVFVGDISGKSSSMYLSILATATAVGGMIYPYIIGYLRNIYGFKGTLLIMGGILSNGFAAALIWQSSLQKHTFKKSKNEKPAEEHIGQNNTEILMPSNMNTIHLSKTGFKQNNKNTILDDSNHEKHATSSSVIECNNDNGNSCINSNDLDIHSKSEIFTLLEKDSSNNNASSFPTNKQWKSSTWDICKLLIRNNTFVVFSIALALVYPAVSTCFIFIADMFNDNGFGESNFYIALLLLNIFGVLDRLSIGFCKQLPRVSTLSLPIMASILGMASMVSMIFIQSLVPSLVVCCVVGVCNGILVAAFTVSSAKLVQTEHRSHAIGVLYTLSGITNATAGPINGLMRDVTGSYTMVFISSASAMCLGTILFIAAQHLRNTTTRKEKNEKHTFTA